MEKKDLKIYIEVNKSESSMCHTIDNDETKKQNFYSIHPSMLEIIETIPYDYCRKQPSPLPIPLPLFDSYKITKLLLRIKLPTFDSIEFILDKFPNLKHFGFECASQDYCSKHIYSPCDLPVRVYNLWKTKKSYPQLEALEILSDDSAATAYYTYDFDVLLDFIKIQPNITTLYTTVDLLFRMTHKIIKENIKFEMIYVHVDYNVIVRGDTWYINHLSPFRQLFDRDAYKELYIQGHLNRNFDRFSYHIPAIKDIHNLASFDMRYCWTERKSKWFSF